MSRTDRELYKAFRELFLLPFSLFRGLGRGLGWLLGFRRPPQTPRLPVAIPLPPEAIPVDDPPPLDDLPGPGQALVVIEPPALAPTLLVIAAEWPEQPRLQPLPPDDEPEAPATDEPRYRKSGKNYVRDGNGEYRRVMQGKRVRYEKVGQPRIAA